MKKVVSFILLFSLNAAAAEVVKFDPRPAVVEQEGSTYVGILLSEEDFRKMLQKKIDTNAKIAECSVDQKVCTQMQVTYIRSITKLEEQLNKNNSWFDRNRGTVGIVTGLLLGTGLSVGIVHAVYQK
jgi:hypothetical protein|tara:strand:- start:10677 stop:11057 length:381 start_codon:yes stop_codon:yes gene_type:complete